eukprot:gene11899-11991_t
MLVNPTCDGHILEAVSTVNSVLSGPPWRHHDLVGLGDWAFSNLADMCRRHLIKHIIPVGHGSCGVLTSDNPDDPHGGAVLPMMDYEQPLPVGVNELYQPLSGGFFDRGSAIMQGSTHQARQMFRMQREQPEQFAKARWFLGLPQYWAWQLSGIAVSEHSILGAQSHLWNVVDRRFSPIVAAQNWQHLMPQFAPAWASLGRIRQSLSQKYAIPSDIVVHAGAHDSSTNYYRYQAAGYNNLAVVSTGTWIVALADAVDIETLDETRGMTCNSDVSGAPLGGALTMGGREFALVAGAQDGNSAADAEVVSRLISRGTMALPAFGENSGQFPGSAGHGQILAEQPASATERRALAVIYSALLTVACLDTLGQNRRAVLDGSFLRDPLYASLVAAFRPDADVHYNLESDGVASGAALLCLHQTRSAPASVALTKAFPPSVLADFSEYARRWFSEATASLQSNIHS